MYKVRKRRLAGPARQRWRERRDRSARAEVLARGATDKHDCIFNYAAAITLPQISLKPKYMSTSNNQSENELSICNKGSPIEQQLEMGADTILNIFLHTYMNVQVQHHQPTKIELELVNIWSCGSKVEMI